MGVVFKIIGSYHKGAKYEFVIKGPKNWDLLDLLPPMLKVSKSSKDYMVVYDFGNSPPLRFAYRESDSIGATLTIEKTLVPTIKKLKIFDPMNEVGTTMINRFVKSIEGKL